MTFAELRADVYAEIGEPVSPTASVQTRIAKYLNECVQFILGEPGMARLLDTDAPITFASVANQARYTVPESIAEIRGMSERTNDRTLRSMTVGDYRRIEPDPASVTGIPTHYVPIGIVAVATQPSDASEIFVDSTSASDTATATIEGIVTGGYLRTASVTMTGTTAVSLSSAITNWIEITDFYLSAGAVGTVTLHEDASGGTELASITPGQKRPRYQGFYLWPTPAAAVTYYVDGRRQYVPLVQDADEPPIPTDYHYILSAYARMRHWEKVGDTRYTIAEQVFRRGLSRLKYATQTSSDELPVMGGRITGHSRLGGYYPADFWTRG